MSHGSCELGASASPPRAIVTVQSHKEWAAKDYTFRDVGQARMFLAMCKRDGDYRTALAMVSA